MVVLSVPIRSIPLVLMNSSIFNLTMILKFITPAHSNGKIIIMFLVVIKRNNKYQWWTATDSSEKQHSVLISTMVDVQYSTNLLLYCVLVVVLIECVASRITHSNHSPNCQIVNMNTGEHVLHHSMVRTQFIEKNNSLHFRYIHRRRRCQRP